MTEKDKELLLKDLCGRLPYKIKGYVNGGIETLEGINTIDSIVEYGIFCNVSIDEFTPYLFPLSSMTEEQKQEYQYITEKLRYHPTYSISDSIDWLHKNHFDYRGLIPMGLAIDATGLNIY